MNRYFFTISQEYGILMRGEKNAFEEKIQRLHIIRVGGILQLFNVLFFLQLLHGKILMATFKWNQLEPFDYNDMSSSSFYSSHYNDWIRHKSTKWIYYLNWHFRPRWNEMLILCLNKISNRCIFYRIARYHLK